MKNKSFYFHWISFLIGFVFGFLGVLFSLFALNERRDKVYSSLMGCFLGIGLSLILLKQHPEAFSKLFTSL